MFWIFWIEIDSVSFEKITAIRDKVGIINAIIVWLLDQYCFYPILIMLYIVTYHMVYEKFVAQKEKPDN